MQFHSPNVFTADRGKARGLGHLLTGPDHRRSTFIFGTHDVLGIVQGDWEVQL